MFNYFNIFKITKFIQYIENDSNIVNYNNIYSKEIYKNFIKPYYNKINQK